MNTVILVEFILYFVVVIGIAYFMSRTKMSHSIFLLGGKKIPGWVLAFSERATGESAWLLLGFTGFVFASGLSGVWVAAGIASGIIFAWLVLSDRKSTRLNSSHVAISYAVFCLKKKRIHVI